MRLILFISILLTGCSYNNEETQIWYSNRFGFLTIDNGKVTHYPRVCIEENKWVPVSGLDEFVVTNIQLYPCHRKNKVAETKVRIKRKRSDLILTSNSLCFEDLFRNPEVILSDFKKIDKKLVYNEIRVSKKFHKKTIEVIITKDDLVQLEANNNGMLSIEEQVWMIFESGLDYYSEYIQPRIDYTYQLRYNGKTVNTKMVNVAPCYLRNLQNYIEEKLVEKAKEHDIVVLPIH